MVTVVIEWRLASFLATRTAFSVVACDAEFDDSGIDVTALIARVVVVGLLELV